MADLRNPVTSILRVAPLALSLVLVSGCATSARGPVDRTVDAAHATNRTVGESVDTVASDPSPHNVVVDAVTFPFRLIGRVFDALVG